MGVLLEGKTVNLLNITSDKLFYVKFMTPPGSEADCIRVACHFVCAAHSLLQLYEFCSFIGRDAFAC
jgi:hypothetical protein